MGRSPKVVFDWSGSLRVARLSWTMAEQLDQLVGERSAAARAALASWLGVYADEFAARIDDEVRTAANLAEQMRGEANGWAEEWRKAMDQENYNRYQDACDRVRDDRDLGDKIAGFFTGHDDLPDQPAPAASPAPPNFAPTRKFASY